MPHPRRGSIKTSHLNKIDVKKPGFYKGEMCGIETAPGMVVPLETSVHMQAARRVQLPPLHVDIAITNLMDELNQCKLTDAASPIPTYPWWYQDALDTIQKEDPKGTMTWDHEWETPIVPSQSLVDVLCQPNKAQPWWATRDGGFAVKDRSLRLGTATWTPDHHARWRHIQNAAYVQGYYSESKNLWAFSDFASFIEDMRGAFVYLDHPKSTRWVRAIDAWFSFHSHSRGS